MPVPGQGSLCIIQHADNHDDSDHDVPMLSLNKIKKTLEQLHALHSSNGLLVLVKDHAPLLLDGSRRPHIAFAPRCSDSSLRSE